MSDWKPYCLALGALLVANTASAQIFPVDFLVPQEDTAIIVNEDGVLQAGLHEVCTAWAPCDGATILVEATYSDDPAEVTRLQRDLQYVFAAASQHAGQEDRPAFLFHGMSLLDPEARESLEQLILEEADTAEVQAQVDFLE